MVWNHKTCQIKSTETSKKIWNMPNFNGNIWKLILQPPTHGGVVMSIHTLASPCSPSTGSGGAAKSLIRTNVLVPGRSRWSSWAVGDVKSTRPRRPSMCGFYDRPVVVLTLVWILMDSHLMIFFVYFQMIHEMFMAYGVFLGVAF